MPASNSLTKNVWVALVMLGLAGELAWAVENQFFNTFMFDNIIPDPRPISWMVAASATAATATTILMGTLSDRTRGRWGRRRPYIIMGYIAWGVLTAVFPLAAFFKPVTLAIVMAILFDCLMTYFGSTAHNAALSAYVTDVTTLDNRGKAMGVLEIMKWVAILIVYGGAGAIIQATGYYTFFYFVGGLVLVVGLIGSSQIRETPVTDKPAGTYWAQIADSFRWRNLVSNREFFLVLLGVSLWAIAQNIFFPYLIIYLNHYLKLQMIESSITMGVVILTGGILAAYPLGLLADQSSLGMRGLFLGRECNTGLAPAVLALRYHAELSTSICYRIALAKWRLEFGPQIPTHENGQPRETEAIMRDVNRALEVAVRRDPANWFWVHRRWKD